MKVVLVISLVLFILALLAFIVAMVCAYIEETFKSIYATIVAITCMTFGFILYFIDSDNRVPKEEDVLKGKAIYQETIHIMNNDTIRTYQIVWKNGNK